MLEVSSRMVETPNKLVELEVSTILLDNLNKLVKVSSRLVEDPNKLLEVSCRLAEGPKTGKGLHITSK